MSVRFWTVAAASLLALPGGQAPAQEAKPAAAVTFERDVQPIFRKYCGKCHNAERPRGELDLMNFAGVTAGGASGQAAVAGKPEESPLYTFTAHIETPHMPPNAPKIPQKDIDVIRRWIEGGMGAKGGEDAAPSAASAAPSGGLVTARVSPRSTPITAIGVNPKSSIVAVSGQKQILLFDLAQNKLLGALAFPEGDVFVLRFSRDGSKLLAAGGSGAEVGKAAIFDTKTWGRTATIGDELDAVLAADLSPDGSQVVIGGPTRLVKVLSTAKGEVVHTFRKPTDWVTAASFSPDGLLVAAGDRFGGLFLWEAGSGKEFLALRGHTKAVNAIAWNPGGETLVTAGDDGSIRMWNLHTGKAVATWDAHTGGVLGLDLDASGRIVSSGRDRHIKIWGLAGDVVADLGPASDQVTRVGWTGDARSVVSGDSAGEARVWMASSADPSSTRLPVPVASKPAGLAMVAPVLAPARRLAPSPKPAAVAVAGDEMEAALASAREAANAANRAVERLSALARSRDKTSDRPSSEAMASANSALSSLRTALASDPENPALKRALEATEEALRTLEKGKPASGR